jgi:hydroxymethylbilane synthase
VSARIAVGTRGSALALAQARLVCDALEGDGRPTRLVIIETEGDRRAPDTAWGEGAFVAAIERALIDRTVDVAVHSAKDVPIEQDARLRIAAYLPRADPRDALVVRADASARTLADLKPGSRIGTDSPRRTGFLRARRPDLIVHPLHGNVDTRLRRLDEGQTDALLLACAGLDRLGLGDRIAERLSPEVVPPAPGQGAIAIQIRADDGRMLGVLAAIDDGRTRLAVEAERAFLEATGGGCRAPVGALATRVDGHVELIAGHANPDGSGFVLLHRRGAPETSRALAIELAEAISVARDRPGPIREALDPKEGADRRRVLVTRAADQAGDLAAALTRVGLDALLVPAIATVGEPPGGRLDEVLKDVAAYRWIVVTSANGARALVDATRRTGTALNGPSPAAVGSATAAVLERGGVTATFQPTVSNAETLGRELPVDTGDHVLLLRGDLATSDLPDALRQRGANVDDLVVYRTEIAPAASRPLLREACADRLVDAVVFTSGSTVDGLLALAAAEGIEIRQVPAICVGEPTARAARSAGFRVAAISPLPDVETLAETTARVLAPHVAEAVHA